jgi:hypothetical protein
MDKNSIPCVNCKLRARYDNNPKSLAGRFWRWHIGFCPGWKAYMNAISEEERLAFIEKYNLKK